MSFMHCWSNVWNTQRVINTGCSMEAQGRSTQLVTRFHFHFILPSHKGFTRFHSTKGNKAARRHLHARQLFALKIWRADASSHRRERRRPLDRRRRSPDISQHSIRRFSSGRCRRQRAPPRRQITQLLPRTTSTPSSCWAQYPLHSCSSPQWAQLFPSPVNNPDQRWSRPLIHLAAPKQCRLSFDSCTA